MRRRTVIYLLAGIAIPTLAYALFTKYSPPKGKVSDEVIALHILRADLFGYKWHRGSFPSGGNRDVIRQLTTPIMYHRNPRTKNGLLLDTWGNPYRMRSDTEGMYIASSGPNKLWGDGDDVLNYIAAVGEKGYRSTREYFKDDNGRATLKEFDFALKEDAASSN